MDTVATTTDTTMDPDAGNVIAEKIFRFRDAKTVPDPYFTLDKTKPKESAIIIDNGSYQCRMGWIDAPFVGRNSSKFSGKGLIYKNVLAKTRRERGKEPELQVANDIVNIEAVRLNLKTPFDRNVVTQFETQETLLDYGFVHLGLNDDRSVDHAVVMTEPFANPGSCRASMSELLFECYSVPKVCYGVDGLFSSHFNGDVSTRLVVSTGFHTVTIIPMVNGEMASDGIRRINLGGFHLTNYLLRGMQLKYPSHTNITVGRAEEMLQEHCRLAPSYVDELSKWRSGDYYARNVRRLQLPFTAAVKPVPVDPEIVRQRRQELAKRLVEMNARKREEKMLEDKNDLRTLTSARTLYEQGYEEKVKRMLSKSNLPSVKSAAELDQLIEKTKGKIEKVRMTLERKKLSAESNEPETKLERPPEKKRRVDMNKLEREEFDLWLEDTRSKWQELKEKRTARRVRKQQLAKRRTAASQERMRMISQLAKHSKKEDNFGMNDDDWDVYKKISKDVGDSDSEEELERLAKYETVLQDNDPNFVRAGKENEISHDSPEWYQLHFATEQIRVPEALFQPSMIGHDQAGISEAIEFVLTKFPANVQNDLVNNVFVTGSLANLPGFKERLEFDLLAARPFKSSFNVQIASNPSCDAWNGAKKFALQCLSDPACFLSRSEYFELGSKHFKEHACSNQLVHENTGGST